MRMTLARLQNRLLLNQLASWTFRPSCANSQSRIRPVRFERKAAERPAFPALHSQAFKAGYNRRGPVDLNLGDFVGTIFADPDSYSSR